MSELLACLILCPYSFTFSFPRVSFLCASLCILGVGLLVIYSNFHLIILLHKNLEGEILEVLWDVSL